MGPLQAVVVSIPTEWILATLNMISGNEPMVYRTITNIPKDARIRGVQYNQIRGSFECIMESDSFRENIAGAEIPRLLLEVIDRKIHSHDIDEKCILCKDNKKEEE